jgi:hypothetical protein
MLVLINPLASAQITGAQKSVLKLKTNDGYKNSEITYKLIHCINNSWGYDVFIDKKLFVHQATRPGMPGNDGFKMKEDAERVAQAVMKKIRNNEMPPTITNDEMKKLLSH